MKRISVMTVLFIVGGLCAACAPTAWPLPSQVVPQISLKPATQSERLEASGVIEVDKITISAEIGGRITRLHVSEGQRVEAGQVLLELDDTLLLAQIGQAQAAVRSAEAELARVSAGARPEQVRAAEAALAQAETRLAGARQAWEDAAQLRDNPLALDTKIQAAENEVQLALARVERATAGLAEARVRYESYQAGGADIERSTKEILAVQVEAAQATLDLAQLGVEAARQTLAALRRLRAEPALASANVHKAEVAYQLAEAEREVRKAALAVAQAGSRPQEVALAQRKVELAQATVEALEARRQKLVLRAPRAGIVATQTVRPGEVAAPGATLLTLSDLAKVRLAVYIPEPQLGRVRVGQAVAVSVNSYPNRVYQGRVMRVATQAEFTPRNVQTKDERVNTVFAVKIELDNPDGSLKPGMPADAVWQE